MSPSGATRFSPQGSLSSIVLVAPPCRVQELLLCLSPQSQLTRAGLVDPKLHEQLLPPSCRTVLPLPLVLQARIKDTSSLVTRLQMMTIPSPPLIRLAELIMVHLVTRLQMMLLIQRIAKISVPQWWNMNS